MMRAIAYVGGTFDLFHTGHTRLLEAAKKTFDEVVVSLNTDEFAARYKRIPVMTFLERAEVLQSCRYVDRVIANIGDENSAPAILISGANFIVHGSDWTGDSLLKQMGIDQQWLDRLGIEMVYLNHTPGISTTQIIERLRDDTHL
jgi:glycerol-3-phosphate cytidylyltransferase